MKSSASGACQQSALLDCFVIVFDATNFDITVFLAAFHLLGDSDEGLGILFYTGSWY